MGLITWPLLIIVAVSTIWYGSRAGLHVFETFSESIEVIEKNSVKTWTAIILPIFGSILLILLFFFLNWLVYLLIALLALSSLIGVSFTFYPLFNRLVQLCKIEREWSVRYIGPVTVSGIFSFLFALICIGIWIGTAYWLITDLLAICLAISAISFIRLPNLKVSFILLGLFFLYDIFWVFLSEYVFGTSVMVNVATKLPSLPVPLPMVIVIPEFSAFEPFHSTSGYALLGVGDIVLPGIFLAFLYRFDDYKQQQRDQTSSGCWKKFASGYFWSGLIAYILAFIFTTTMVIVMNRGQPALLYLVPFTLGITVILGLIRKELKTLWKGDLPQTRGIEDLQLFFFFFVF